MALKSTPTNSNYSVAPDIVSRRIDYGTPNPAGAWQTSVRDPFARGFVGKIGRVHAQIGHENGSQARGVTMDTWSLCCKHGKGGERARAEGPVPKGGWGPKSTHPARSANRRLRTEAVPLLHRRVQRVLLRRHRGRRLLLSHGRTDGEAVQRKTLGFVLQEQETRGGC